MFIIMWVRISIVYFVFLRVAFAQSVYIPVADDNVYVTGVVSEPGILVPSPTIHSMIVFSAFSANPNTQYLLDVNQYDLPIGGDMIEVYGFASQTSEVTGADFNAGTYLGTITLPSNITYGQSVSLDVSSFVSTSPGPYWDFSLRDAVGDGLSSLEENYGTPPEIIATPVPEPSVLVLSFLAIGCCMYLFRQKERA